MILCNGGYLYINNKIIFPCSQDDRNLQFNSGIKVYGNKLYVATSRLQNYITARVPMSEENYRVLEGDVHSLIRGTSCQVDQLNNRFEDEYEPDSENVDFETNDFTFAHGA